MEAHEEEELRGRLERLKAQDSNEGSHAHGEGHRKGGFLGNRYIFIAIIAAILVINIVLRLGLAKYTGFFEPDGFFHYSVIRQALTMNHGIVPMNLTLSGFPLHNSITEPGGLYYVTILPYFILKYFGLSYYTVMRYIPILFGILDALGAYFLAKYLTNSRVAGLLAMLFVSISSGDIARTSALVYRGDGFVTIFVLVAFMMFIKTCTSYGRRQWAFAGLAGVSLAVAAIAWGGSPFSVVAFLSAIALLTVYSFIKADEKLLKSAILLSLGMLLFYALQRLSIAVKLLRYVPTLGSLHFFIFYMPILLGSLAALYLVKNRHKLGFASGTWQRRAALSIVLVAVAVLFIIFALPGYVSQLLLMGTGSGPVGSTIQELQHPSWTFIWQSFSWQIILAPIGVALFLLLGRRIVGKERRAIANIAFVAMVSYLLVTVWLQLGAIRYNSLVSVPIAIFAAYTVYGVPKVLRNFKIRWLMYIPIGIFLALILVNIRQTYNASFTGVQADGITPQFLQAMSWLRNNTAGNATVLALWPDGSVVEGWANRTSLMDSVGGQNDARIYNFSQWLFSTTPNATYLYNAGRPQYLVARTYWLYEIGGIATEGEIANSSQYGYDMMSSLTVRRSQNSTIDVFNSSAYPYYRVDVVANRTGNQTSSVQAYVGSALSSNVYAIRRVFFINLAGGTPYSVIESALSTTANYSLVVYYNGTQISGGALMGPKMPYSNFFRLVALCNYAECPYNSSGVTMRVVYENGDTRIIKINYAANYTG